MGVLLIAAALAHPHDPEFMAKASRRILDGLGTPAGALALERAARRLLPLALKDLGGPAGAGVDIDEALRVALPVLPEDLRDPIRQARAIDEAGEVLLLWGGEREPDREMVPRILERSAATSHLLRKLRYRLRRHLGIQGARNVLPSRKAAPAEDPRPGETMDQRRERWCREVLPRGAPAAPLPLPVLRYDGDRDGHPEMRAVDADVDGTHDRWEADLDGDDIFETGFLKKSETWTAVDSPHARLAPAPAPGKS